MFCHKLVLELAAVLYCCIYKKTSVPCGSRVGSAETFAVYFKSCSICHAEVIPCEVRLCVLVSAICVLSEN